MLEEILSLNVFAFMMIFARVGTAFFLFPGFQGKQVNVKSRLALALAVSFLLTPLLMEILPPMPGDPLMLLLILGGEILSGAVLGTAVLVMFSAMQVAGTVISFVSAMANAMIFDPISQQQSAIVGGFLSTAATLLLFVTDLHHVLIKALIDSYILFQPGGSPIMGDISELIVRQVSSAFKLGIQLAAPFIVISIVYNFALGLMTRLSPNIPIFFVAMPAQLVLGIVILMIVLPGILLTFISRVQVDLLPFISP